MGTKLIIAGREVEIRQVSRQDGTLSFIMDGKAYRFAVTGKTVQPEGGRAVNVEAVKSTPGKPWQVLLPEGECWVEEVSARRRGAEGTSDKAVRAPMPGQVVRVMAEPGARMAKGDALLVVEAMKLQLTLSAPCDGTVAAVHVAAKDQVQDGDVLVEMEPDAAG